MRLMARKLPALNWIPATLSAPAISLNSVVVMLNAAGCTVARPFLLIASSRFMSLLVDKLKLSLTKSLEPSLINRPSLQPSPLPLLDPSPLLPSE
jgi:hypothetical protein